MPRARPPKITVEMCEEKIAELEDENEHLRRILEHGENACMHLDADEVLQLASTLSGLADYVKAHMCSAHRVEAVKSIINASQAMQWFAEAVAETFTEEEMEAARVRYHAEQVAATLADAPHDGAFN